MMHARIAVPSPPLSEFIAYFWSNDDEVPSHARERILPTGTIDLLINIRESSRIFLADGSELRFDVPVVCGPHSRHFAVDTAFTGSTVAVHFKPGGASPLLGLPAAELRNLIVPLDELWGQPARHLNERLLAAGDVESRFAIVEDFLLQLVLRARVPHEAVGLAVREIQARPHQSIAGVSSRIGLTPQRLGQLFRDEIGLGPKMFARVRRFAKALDSTTAASRPELADVALASGYFDQAHFNHDFQAFAGISPTIYLKSRGDDPTHVRVDE
jgi:AraC-like DNA-binding protein